MISVYRSGMTNFTVFGVGLLLTPLTYGLMYPIAGGETTGMRCAQLKLATFDGVKPDGPQWTFERR